MLEGLSGFQPGDHVCVAKLKAFLLPGEGVSSRLLAEPDAPDWWPAVVEERRGPRVYVLRLLRKAEGGPHELRVMAPVSGILRLGDESCPCALFHGDHSGRV